MGAFIAAATLEQIRAASDIVDVIGAVIPLKRAGANFVALCPFHKEKSPSFNVNPHKQIFHCFGCHKGGDVFAFVKEYESIDFPDAIRRLAERAHIPLETDAQPGPSQNRHLKDQLLHVHEQITQRWQSALETDNAGQIARDYLARRGVSAEAIKLFRLGYAPDLWDDTVKWAKSKHFDLPLVEQAGLIIRKEGADHYYDRFRGRLIFPICDEQGRVIGFSGRILAGDEGTAKYVNSPESAIFSKGKVMFGLDKSKRALLDSHTAIICEGQLDLIACFMGGVKNVVAPQGTALTADHTRILKRYVEEVVLCFDSDNAGQNAAVRSLPKLLASGELSATDAPLQSGFRERPRESELSESLPDSFREHALRFKGQGSARLLGTGLSVRIAVIPSPHDPDSYIKEFGGSAFAALIAKARPYFDVHLDRLCATHDVTSDRGRQSIVDQMGVEVNTTANEVIIDTYAQKTALRLGVSADAVRAAFKKSRRAPVARTDDSAPPDTEAAATRPPEIECWLLRLTLETDDFIDWIAAHLEPEWLSHAEVREIISRRLHAHADGTWNGVAAWLSETDNSAWNALVTEILASGRPMAEPEAVLKGSPTREGAVKILRDKSIDRQLAAANQRLAIPDLSESDQTTLVQQTQNLRQMKRQPLAAKAETG